MADTQSFFEIRPDGLLADGKYRFVRALAPGGMSDVWLVRHKALDRTDVFKRIKEGMEGDGDDSDAKRELLEKRFLREGRVMARIDHPNCIRVLDLGTMRDRTPYLILEYFESDELADLRFRAPNYKLEQAFVIEVSLQVLAALSAVHEQGVLHRDIKPENILVGKKRGAEGEFLVKLIDFGVAGILEGTPEPSTEARGGSKLKLVPPPRPVTQLTKGNFSLVGTPYYMSPEIVLQQKPAAAADVYSLGATIFHLLTGQPPFEAKDLGVGEDETEESAHNRQLVEIIYAHVSNPVPRMKEVDTSIDAELSELVYSMMLKKPAQRPTVEEVRAKLLQIQKRLGKKSAGAGGGIRQATMMYAGQAADHLQKLIKHADQKLEKRAVERADTGSPDELEVVTTATLWERWRFPMLVGIGGLVALILGIWAFKKAPVVLEEQVGVVEPELQQQEHRAPPIAPVVISPPISSRDLDDELAPRGHRREIDTDAPSYDPQPTVVEVNVAPVPQPPPEVVKIKPPKPKATPAQLFQQASVAFASNKKDKACSLAKQAIAAAEKAKPGSSNAMRKATRQFGCGP